MADSRIKNTRRNILFSYADTMISLIFRFVSRTVIVYTLGDAYLGLSSLFGSILEVLNMAELGFSSAIVYNLYKPLAEKDTDKVCALLAYYRKVYRIVGIVIVVVGLAVMPFLPSLIKEGVPPGINLHILYLLYLANTGISYFLFAYKTSLLDALQRTDLTKIAYSAASITQYTLQILCLLVWKNYYAFMVVLILGTAVRNLFAAWIAKKKYPQYECRGEIGPETRKDIISRVKGLLVCNISGMTYTTFDSIILSTFVGLSAVAIYNNYLVIFQAVASMIVMIRGAMQASVGNSIASESVEKNYQDMLLWQFLFAVIATWCVTCMMSLYQPFMIIWMGAERLLPMIDVILICTWFFTDVVQHSFFLYMSGNGLWWEMRWPYILSTVCNLILNIVLGKLLGTTGIIFSTLFSTAVFGLIWQCTILFRVYFRTSIFQFLLRFIGYLLVCGLSAGGAYLINSGISVDGIPGLLVRGAVCTVFSGAVMTAIYSRLPIYRRAKIFAGRVIRRDR